MSEVLLEVVRQRIQLTHGWLLKVIDELTVEELGRRLAPTATPIGWHLWHVSRWADRLHASFPNRPYSPGGRWDAERQLWFQDGLSRRWGLDPRTLGILQTGSWMDDDAAVAVARAGRDPLVDYARRTLAAVDAIVASLDSAGLAASRNSIMEFADGQHPVEVPGAATTVAGDLGFHLSHTSRHLGMIEGLTGLLGRHGTATT